MTIPTRTREAIKTALAMTLAYGIGLQAGWDRPYWAGFAVAFISLSTVGQSLNKGALRLLGTLVAAIVALTLIGLFAQHRWLFIFFLSLWFALCTYMNMGKRHQYFWFVAAFVSLIIAADGGLNSENAFSIAMLRTQQTGLGILVYSLVSVMLWPNNSRKDLEATARRMASTQQQLFGASVELLRTANEPDSLKSLRTDEITIDNRLATLVDAAVTDSDEIREAEKIWRDYQGASTQLAEAMQRWRENFSDLQTLPLQQLLPQLDAYIRELEYRFSSITKMMDSVAPPQPCSDISLDVDQAVLKTLPQFHRAALRVTRDHMANIEILSRRLYESISAIRGFTEPEVLSTAATAARTPWAPDPDRLLGAAKIMLVLWLAFLAVIYIADFPGGLGFLGLAGPISLIMVSSPQIPVSILFAPFAIWIAFSSVLYIFVMPQLSSFTGLGLMIFMATFFICYLNASPQKALGRAVGLGIFVTLIAVSNQQSYNFLVPANAALELYLLLFLLWIVSLIPHSPRPERAMLRLLNRYFYSAGFLLGQSVKERHTPLNARRQAFHRQELASIPAKLGVWAGHLDTNSLGSTSAQVPALLDSLQALTYRLQELLEARTLSQSPLLAATLTQDMQNWRQRLLEDLRQLPAVSSAGRTEIRADMDSHLAQLEERIQASLDTIDDGTLDPVAQGNFYRLLGAYRGSSSALMELVDRADQIDWQPWHEERFA